MTKNYLEVSKIFIAGLVIGFLNGIGIMYLLNGILGHAGMKESIMAFLSFGTASVFTVLMVFKRLKKIWRLKVQHPYDEHIAKIPTPKSYL